MKPAYTRTLYDVVVQLDACAALCDRMQAMNMPPAKELVLNERTLSTTRWKTREELLEDRFVGERVKEADHSELLMALARLVELPFSYKFKDFIWQFRAEEESIHSASEGLPQPETDERGRQFVEAIGEAATEKRAGKSHQNY